MEMEEKMEYKKRKDGLEVEISIFLFMELNESVSLNLSCVVHYFSRTSDLTILNFDALPFFYITVMATDTERCLF